MCTCITHQVSFFNFIEILTTDIIFMAKELVLAFSNQVILKDYIWKRYSP